MKRLSAAKAPLTILLVIVSLDLLVWASVLPNKVVMFNAVSNWLANGGLPFVFALSIIENVAFFNIYFPGSIAILAAMVGTEGEFTKVISVWFVVTFGAVLGQLVTFMGASRLLAYFSKASAVSMNSNFGFSAWFRLGVVSFWHPHLASMACLSMAEASVSMKRFLLVSAFSTGLWNAFWSVFVLFFGNIFSDSYVGTILVYLYLLGWVSVKLFKSEIV